MKKTLLVIIATAVLFCVPGLSQAYYEFYMLYDDATGGDCIKIGTWNPETKTCTMAVDILNASWGISIAGDGISLDGNGHTISGLNRYRGVDVFFSDNVTIKNIAVSNFAIGVFSQYANSLTITDSVFSENISQTRSWNDFRGIHLLGGGSVLITRNDFLNNGNGLIVDTEHGGNRIFNNNFINNISHADDLLAAQGYSFYYQDLPTGGNYWSADLSDGECLDNNQDGLCDSKRSVNVHWWDYYGNLRITEQGLVDLYPWARPNGWVTGAPGNPGDNTPPKETSPYELLMRKLQSLEHMGLVSSAKSITISIDKGDKGSAINKLEALRNKIEAQAGKKLTTEEAKELIDLVIRSIRNL